MKRTAREAGEDLSTAPALRIGASKLVLFDFDGTITTKDTLIEFVRYYRGHKGYWLGMLSLSPVLMLFLLKVIPNWKAKQFFLSRFFKGEKIDEFNARCLQFCTTKLPALIRPKAKEAIERYRREGVTIAVVTASAENWVKPWCDRYDILCLGTRLEVRDGLITGKFDGRNCHGDEKVCRIREHFNLAEFTEIIAYGDSSGDTEMLELASHGYYKPFRD